MKLYAQKIRRNETPLLPLFMKKNNTKFKKHCVRNTLTSSSPKLAQIYKTKSCPLKIIIQTKILKPNKETFFITPTTDEEISDIISDLNISL